MAIQKTEAFVLKTQPFRSTSMISTFFTRDFGKVRALAKGVRDERQHRSASFELFTKLDLVYYEKSKSDLHLVSEYFILESYQGLRTSLENISYASYFVELVDKLSEIYDPHLKLFELLESAFRYLPSLPGERLSRIFEVKLLNEIGWLPFLTSCVECGNRQLEQGYFSPRHGTLLCERCRSKYPDAVVFHNGTLRAIRHYIKHDLEEAIRFPLAAPIEGEMQSVMQQFFLERVDSPLKTRQFLDRIRPALR